MFGGQQEHGIRPGTIPVALVAGLGKACEIAEREYQQQRDTNQRIKAMLLGLLSRSGLKYSINGAQEFCISTTLNLSIEGVSSEALMLSTKQFCGVSNGSACNSNSYAPSYVLTAMGIPSSQVESSIRISWGASVDLAEFEQQFNALIKVAQTLA
jgi:cysteine desulfurase